ncbi:nuclear transport factor 2 family protein [Streptomyces sp. NPDC003036]|uniref:nuclear transport factor 2 family protein n=1 Tax=Streptomyces sp. NPDC003036 TaxID=3154442 RepID=UPI0033BB395B
MTAHDHTPAVAAAIERELRLLDPAVRRDPVLFAALLHPDFHEFGRSGRHWDRASMTAEITAAAADDAPRSAPPTASRMRGVQLADDVVHLTFDTERDGHWTHRSSVWRRTDRGWLLYFHQGTPFTPVTQRQ